MKSKLINTGVTEIFIIELPDGAVNVRESMGYIIARTPNYKNTVRYEALSDPYRLTRYLQTHTEMDDYKDFAHKLPSGNWKHLCPASEVTEEQAKVIVKESNIRKFQDYTYENKNLDPIGLLDALLEYSIDTALESYESMLEDNNIRFTNPWGGKEPYCTCEGACNENCEYDEWTKFEFAKWDKQRTHIFIKQK